MNTYEIALPINSLNQWLPMWYSARKDTVSAPIGRPRSGQELRLRRYNRRLQDKYGHGRPASEIYVAQNFVPAVELEVEEAPEQFQSVVVGEHTTNILCRTVGEADVQLDFVEQPVLMFSNTVDGHLNGVYSRPDSYMGWITSMTESGG